MVSTMPSYTTMWMAAMKWNSSRQCSNAFRKILRRESTLTMVLISNKVMSLTANSESF